MSIVVLHKRCDWSNRTRIVHKSPRKNRFGRHSCECAETKSDQMGGYPLEVAGCVAQQTKERMRGTIHLRSAGAMKPIHIRRNTTQARRNSTCFSTATNIGIAVSVTATMKALLERHAPQLLVRKTETTGREPDLADGERSLLEARTSIFYSFRVIQDLIVALQLVPFSGSRM